MFLTTQSIAVSPPLKTRTQEVNLPVYLHSPRYPFNIAEHQAGKLWILNTSK